MSISQKFSGFSIVPWYNSAEWKRVFHLIFDDTSTSDDKHEALRVISLWKTRMSLLPSGIEGTLYILEALLVDCSLMSERQCCIMYSSNVMRFLNICVANRSPVFNFTKTVKSYSIPDWIINIRHDFAHSHKLPSLSILKLALAECFKWLKETYWVPELAVIKDYVLKKDSFDNKHVVNLIAKLIVWYNNNTELLDQFKDDLVRYGIDYRNMDNFPEVMNELFRNIGDGCEDDIVGDLIFSTCFFISPMSTDKKSTRSYKYISQLIVYLQENNYLVNLVNELCTIINDEVELESNRISVSQWLNEIFIGLVKRKHREWKTDELKGKGINFKQVPQSIIENISAFKCSLFRTYDDITRICYNSFLLLTTSCTLKDSNTFFNSMKNAETRARWQNLEETADFMDLAKTSEICQSHSLINFDKTVSQIDCDNSTPSIHKRRWVIDTNPEYEKCPLGVLPCMLNTATKTCYI